MSKSWELTTTWTVQIRPEELAIALIAYKAALPAINTLRKCHRFRSTSYAKLPAEIVDKIEQQLVQAYKDCEEWRYWYESAKCSRQEWDSNHFIWHLSRDNLLQETMFRLKCPYCSDSSDRTCDNCISVLKIKTTGNDDAYQKAWDDLYWNNDDLYNNSFCSEMFWIWRHLAKTHSFFTPDILEAFGLKAWLAFDRGGIEDDDYTVWCFLVANEANIVAEEAIYETNDWALPVFFAQEVPTVDKESYKRRLLRAGRILNLPLLDGCTQKSLGSDKSAEIRLMSLGRSWRESS